MLGFPFKKLTFQVWLRLKPENSKGTQFRVRDETDNTAYPSLGLSLVGAWQIILSKVTVGCAAYAVGCAAYAVGCLSYAVGSAAYGNFAPATAFPCTKMTFWVF